MDSQPGAKTYGVVGNWLDGPECNNSDATVLTNLNYGPLSIPALAPGFDPIAYAGDSYDMSYTVPGANLAASKEIHAMRSYSTTPPDATHPIQPVMSPVNSPLVNNLSLFADQNDVGKTPTISWTAPDLATPEGYIIYVYQLGTDSLNNGTYSTVACLYLNGSQTSTTLPAGILTTGDSYFFVIRALTSSPP